MPSKIRSKQNEPPCIEKTALRLLQSRMEQKNGVQNTLQQSGVLFKIDEIQNGMPEIISEETFIELLQMNMDSGAELPESIDDEGWENDDLEDDGLTFIE